MIIYFEEAYIINQMNIILCLRWKTTATRRISVSEVLFLYSYNKNYRVMYKH